MTALAKTPAPLGEEGQATTGEPARPTLAGSPVRWAVSPYAACVLLLLGLVWVVAK